jgi:2-Cys peroxiredoxin 5
MLPRSLLVCSRSLLRLRHTVPSSSSFVPSFSSYSPSLRLFATRSMSSSESKVSPAEVGTLIPTKVTVHEGTPKDVVDLEALFAKKKVILFGVPGAFTPTCSAKHLPGYVNDAEKLKAKGVNEIVCLSVNDAFVMTEWGKALNVNGKVRMLADTNAEFVKALGLDFHAPVLGGIRSKRFSAVVEDKKITQINVEPDNTGASCSLVQNLKL